MKSETFPHFWSPFHSEPPVVNPDICTPVVHLYTGTDLSSTCTPESTQNTMVTPVPVQPHLCTGTNSNPLSIPVLVQPSHVHRY